MRNKMSRTFFVVFRRFRDPYYQGAAAELAFFLLLSIIPIVTILFHFLSISDVTVKLVETISREFSKNELISTILHSIGDMNGGVSIAFLIPAIWAASKFEFSMIRMANYTYGFGERNAAVFIKNRLRAIVTIIGLIITLVLGLIILVYGDSLLKLANIVLSEFLGFQLHIDLLSRMLKWPLALVIYCIFIAVNYSVLPKERIPVKKTIPGSIFVSVGIIVVSILYYSYFNNFSKFNMIYGSFAAVVALLLWFYFLGYVLVLGMLINAVWFDETLE